MIQARSDLRAVATIPEPLSDESVRSLFDDIRENLGLPRRAVDELAKLRSQRRIELVGAGFPFATDVDYNDI